MAGSVVDFSPFHTQVAGLGEILDPISAGIRAASEEAQRRKRHDEEMAFRREQEQRLAQRDTIATSRENRIEANQRAREVVANNERQSKADAAIRAAAGVPGNLPEAERLAKGYSEVDPTTNKVVQGRPFAVRPNPAPEQPTGYPEGPVPDDLELRKAAAIRAEQASFEPGADQKPDVTVDSELGKLNEADQPFQDRQVAGSAYARKMAAYKMEQQNPHVSIGGVETTPQDIRYTRSKADAQDFRASMAPLQQKLAQAQQIGDPLVIASVQRQIDKAAEMLPQVEQGIIDPIKATSQVNSAGTAEAGMQAKLGMQREHDQTAGKFGLERAQVSADAAASRAAAARTAASGGDMGLDPKKLNPINAHIQDIEKQHHITATKDELNKTQMILDNQNDPVMQRSMAYNVIARGLAGEKGPLSKDDVTRLTGRLQGAFGDVENWFSTNTEGTMSDAQLQAVLPAVREVLKSKQRDLDAAKVSYQKGILDNGVYKAYGPGAQAHIQSRYREIFGEDPPASATRAPRGRAPVDPSNPDDPNAPDAGRPLDGDIPPKAPAGREDVVRERAAKAGLDPDQAVERARKMGLL